ncbi:protein of unknown function [Agreia sp. COWG]|nr:protein of unknown function [Agreia sp. COWG]
MPLYRCLAARIHRAGRGLLSSPSRSQVSSRWCEAASSGRLWVDSFRDSRVDFEAMLFAPIATRRPLIVDVVADGRSPR